MEPAVLEEVASGRNFDGDSMLGPAWSSNPWVPCQDGSKERHVNRVGRHCLMAEERGQWREGGGGQGRIWVFWSQILHNGIWMSIAKLHWHFFEEQKIAYVRINKFT